MMTMSIAIGYVCMAIPEGRLSKYGQKEVPLSSLSSATNRPTTARYTEASGLTARVVEQARDATIEEVVLWVTARRWFGELLR